MKKIIFLVLAIALALSASAFAGDKITVNGCVYAITGQGAILDENGNKEVIRITSWTPGRQSAQYAIQPLWGRKGEFPTCVSELLTPGGEIPPPEIIIWAINTAPKKWDKYKFIPYNPEVAVVAKADLPTRPVVKGMESPPQVPSQSVVVAKPLEKRIVAKPKPAAAKPDPCADLKAMNAILRNASIKNFNIANKNGAKAQEMAKLANQNAKIANYFRDLLSEAQNKLDNKTPWGLYFFLTSVIALILLVIIIILGVRRGYIRRP